MEDIPNAHGEGVAPSKSTQPDQADRTVLTKLLERVEQIVDQLAKLERAVELRTIGSVATDVSAFRFGGAEARASVGDIERSAIRATRPPLPDPKLVRAIIRNRQSRSKYFDGNLFADPAWDMLLDLTAARAEHKRVSVTSLCIASRVPLTTALRWITQLEQADLVSRSEDDLDRRRAFLTLTAKGANAMARYFSDLSKAGTDIRLI